MGVAVLGEGLGFALGHITFERYSLGRSQGRIKSPGERERQGPRTEPWNIQTLSDRRDSSWPRVLRRRVERKENR